MLLENERRAVVEYGKLLVTRGLTRGTGGNISVLDRAQRLFAISPSGIDYFETEPQDVVVLDLEGKIIDGVRKPSSELAMHRRVYCERPEFAAIVHTHSTFATALSCTRQGLPPVSYLVALAGSDVPCAPYATFGTEELARAACESIEDRRAVLLSNHGLLTAGESISEAFMIAEQIEFCCEIYCHARAFGDVRPLGIGQMNDAMRRFGSYGQ